MSKRRSTQGGSPTMSNADKKATFSELDQLHGHCLSLIATCTQLGVDLRDTLLMKHVADLPTLVGKAETLSTRLPEMHAELKTIRDADLGLRNGPLGHSNIMAVLNVGQRYETWLSRFGRGVSPIMESMCGIIEDARSAMGTETGSSA